MNRQISIPLLAVVFFLTSCGAVALIPPTRCHTDINADQESLLKIYHLARPVASIVKALQWHNTISRLDGALRDEYAWIVPEVLREFMVNENMLKVLESPS